MINFFSNIFGYVLNWIYLFAGPCSAFQGAEHNAFDKIFLEERISENNGKRRKDNHGILHLYRGDHLTHGVADIGRVELGKVHRLRHKNALQVQLKRVQRLIRQIHLCRKPVVPHGDDRVNGNHRQNRLCKGKIDPEQDHRIACAVNERRFPDIFRNTREICSCKNDIPDAERCRNDDSKNIIVKMQAVHHQKRRNQPAAEIHGQQNERYDEFAPAQLRYGKGICTQHAGDKNQYCGRRSV